MFYDDVFSNSYVFLYAVKVKIQKRLKMIDLSMTLSYCLFILDIIQGQARLADIF